MTEKKLTEAEIMKALETISKELADVTEFQLIEPHNVRKISYFCKDVIDLINRKNAEIGKLNFENLQMLASIKGLEERVRAEAIKEFAERAKKQKYQSSDWSHGEHPFVVEEDDIDEIAKEMGVEL